jgi:aspartate racemase
MTAHIGIVGCSSEGAALCYTSICALGEGLMGAHAHPEVSMHTPSLSRYVESLEQGNLQGVADLMLDSAHKLATMGADFLVCPDNTIHQAFELVRRRSPLPWLHIAEVVADAAVTQGFRRVGITGTRWLVDSDVYSDAMASRGIEAVRPCIADRETCARIIMDELVRGEFLASSTTVLRGVVGRLATLDCEAVVLGCTELPLVLGPHNVSLPVLDSTRLLAEAAVAKATAMDVIQ